MINVLIDGVSYRLVHINHGKSLVTLVDNKYLVSIKFTFRDYPLCARCALYHSSDMNRGLRYFCVSYSNTSGYKTRLSELCNFIHHVDAFHDEYIVTSASEVRLSMFMSIYLIRLGYDRN